MRLSDVLSKPLHDIFMQVEGFLGNQRISIGKHKKITVGKVGLNYFCKECNEVRTYVSGDELSCLCVCDDIVSIDCVLHCPTCGKSNVQVWFLVHSEEQIFDRAPRVRVFKYRQNLSAGTLFRRDEHGGFTELLEKAEKAYKDGLGAGAMVYLRKIFEKVTAETADAVGINKTQRNGQRKTFKLLLKEVDEQCSIIPAEFSANGYQLFGELSNVVHGDTDEQVGLEKYKVLYRLVVGILENIKNSDELRTAVASLGWSGGGGTQQ